MTMASWKPPSNNDERTARSVRSMLDGSLDGRVAEAREISVEDAVSTLVAGDEYEADLDLGEGSDDGDYFWYRDTHIVETTGEQTIRLTYVPVDDSVDIYYGNTYIPKSNWNLHDDRYITLPDTGIRYHAGRKFTATYAWTEQTVDDPDLTPVTMDIPTFTLYEFDHAGATGGIVGSNPLGTEDGDSSYAWVQETGLTGGVTGYGMYVKFPPTSIPGTVVSTSLVIQSKGFDSRSANAAYEIGNRFTQQGANQVNHSLFNEICCLYFLCHRIEKCFPIFGYFCDD